MKLKGFIITFLFFSIMLLSCGYNGDDSVAESEYLLLIDTILDRKKDDLNNLFAKNISSKLNNFDNQIEGLINYVSGTLVSNKYSGTGAIYTIDNLKQVRFLPMVGCELYTTDYKYFFSIHL